MNIDISKVLIHSYNTSENDGCTMVTDTLKSSVCVIFSVISASKRNDFMCYRCVLYRNMKECASLNTLFEHLFRPSFMSDLYLLD
jgi:hypothetical protein